MRAPAVDEWRAATRRFEPKREQTALAWPSTFAMKDPVAIALQPKLPDPSLNDLTARGSSDCRIVIPTHWARPRYIAMKRPRSDSNVFLLSPSRVVFTRWSEPVRHAS